MMQSKLFGDTKDATAPNPCSTIKPRFVMKVKTINVEYAGEPDGHPPEMTDSSAAAKVIRAWMDYQGLAPDQEAVTIFGTDSRHRLIYAETHTRGTFDQSPVDVQRIFCGLLLAQCRGAVLSHNHPSGDLTPSRDDLDITRALVKAGKIVRVPFHDHIITTPSGEWVSLRTTNPSLF